MNIKKAGTGIFFGIFFSSLVACSTVTEHQATAYRLEKPTGSVTRTFSVHYLSAADIHAICAPHQACERSGDIFMEARGAWQGVDEYTLTWNFTGAWPEMDGTTITSPAWPPDDLLGELLAENLNLPAGDYRHHRLFAHEVMHVFGMRHFDD